MLAVLLILFPLAILAFALPTMRNTRGWGDRDSHCLAQGKQPRGPRGQFMAYPQLQPLYPIVHVAAITYVVTLAILLVLIQAATRSMQ